MEVELSSGPQGPQTARDPDLRTLGLQLTTSQERTSSLSGHCSDFDLSVAWLLAKSNNCPFSMSWEVQLSIQSSRVGNRAATP